MENYKQIGVWIDHTKAHLIGFKSGQAKLLETVDSPHESIKRIDGEGKDMTRFSPNPEHTSNNEYKRHKPWNCSFQKSIGLGLAGRGILLRILSVSKKVVGILTETFPTIASPSGTTTLTVGVVVIFTNSNQ
jgi:hypothetical protein